MIITNQPNQPIIDKEINKNKKSEKSEKTSSEQGSKSLFSKASVADEQISLIDKKLASLTNKLLNSLKAGEQNLSQSKALQVAPNLASDIKELVKELKNNEKLSQFTQALEKFIKPIDTIKAQNVASHIQNSGVLLEAKIAQSLESQDLPAKIKELISLMKNVSSNELKQGILSLPNDASAAKNLSDLNELLGSAANAKNAIIKNSALNSLMQGANKLENIVKFLDKLSANPAQLNSPSAHKALQTLQNDLNETMKSINNLNLNAQNLATAKQIRLAINQNANELKSALDMLKNGDANFKTALQTPRSLQNATQNTAQNTLNAALNAAPKNMVNNANANAKSAPNINANINATQVTNHSPLNASNVQTNQQNLANNSALNATNQPNMQNAAQNASAQNMAHNATQTNAANANAQNATMANANNANALNQGFKNINAQLFSDAISQDVNGANLQGKISAIANRINSLVNAIDPKLAAAKNDLSEIKGLQHASKAAAKQLELIKPNDQEAALKSLQNDLKSVLLNLKESSQAPNMQNINQAVNRMLTQIEIHQLMSYAQNSIQTYLPYTWDDLSSSQVAFKRGKKDRFYARIELNFVRFGDISIVLGLSENKYLDISIQTAKGEFKDKILGQTSDLKQALSAQGLIINSFFLSNKNTQNAYEKLEQVELGYNVKA